MKNVYTRKFLASFSPEQYEALRKVAFDRHVPMAKVVRESLDQYLVGCEAPTSTSTKDR